VTKKWFIHKKDIHGTHLSHPCICTYVDSPASGESIGELDVHCPGGNRSQTPETISTVVLQSTAQQQKKPAYAGFFWVERLAGLSSWLRREVLGGLVQWKNFTPLMAGVHPRSPKLSVKRVFAEQIPRT
jgi:hypothetical protein